MSLWLAFETRSRQSLDYSGINADDLERCAAASVPEAEVVASTMGMPHLAREALGELVAQIEALVGRIERLDSRMVRYAREGETVRRLASIPGIGAIGATALTAMVPNPHGFASARHFAASLGLTPQPHSSGGKERLGRISRQGNSMLRRLLVLGATSRCAMPGATQRSRTGPRGCWRDGPSKLWPWRWPTRWSASPEPCWPGEGPTPQPRPPRRSRPSSPGAAPDGGQGAEVATTARDR
jgi:hypothetical protein